MAMYLPVQLFYGNSAGFRFCPILQFKQRKNRTFAKESAFSDTPIDTAFVNGKLN